VYPAWSPQQYAQISETYTEFQPTSAYPTDAYSTPVHYAGQSNSDLLLTPPTVHASDPNPPQYPIDQEPLINLPQVEVKMPTLEWRYYSPQSFDTSYDQKVENPQHRKPKYVEVIQPGPIETPNASPAQSNSELDVSISEYQTIPELLIDTDLKLKLEAITEEPKDIKIEPLGKIVSNTLIYLTINATNHPTLFSSFMCEPDSNGNHYVKVQYARNFSRVVRISKTEGWDAKAHPGRPLKGIEWHHYQPGGTGDCFSCGRQFAGRKGKESHLDEKRGSRMSCEVVRIQQGRDRCYFCDAPIRPSKDVPIIEQHTKVCKPLSELKSLIHPCHLQDFGLRIEEVEAFDWPGDRK
jgi:hypothetical protein